MKVLHFQHRGEWYKVKEDGSLLQENNTYNEWGKDWIFLGVTKHHWKNSLDISLKEAFKNPEKLKKGIVWDIDHGTRRIWGGNYFGKLPRITNAYVERDK